MSEDDTAATDRKAREAASAASEQRASAKNDEKRAEPADETPAESPRTGGHGKPARGAVPPDKPEYPIERLIAESQDFLGCPPHVAAGALHDADSKTMTVADAKAAVKDWLKREIDPPEEV